MDHVKKYRISLFVVVGLLVAGLVAWQLILFFSFRVVSISPNPRKPVATSTENFEIKFNKELDAGVDYSQQVAKNSFLVKSIQVRKKSLLIDLKTLENKQYSFTLSNVLAKNGQNMSELTIRFKAKYIPYNELSEAEKRRQLEQTDVGAVEDPLDKFLPHGDLGYYLTGAFLGEGENYRYTLHARITLSKSDVNTGRDAAIQTQKQMIQEYIKSKNIDPAGYPISYEIVDPPF